MWGNIKFQQSCLWVVYCVDHIDPQNVYFAFKHWLIIIDFWNLSHLGLFSLQWSQLNAGPLELSHASFVSIDINWGVRFNCGLPIAKRWSEVPLDEMMGKMHCYAIAIASCFHWIIKSLCWSYFSTCVVSVAHFSAGLVVEWEGWNFTGSLNSLHLCNDDGEVELSRLPEVIHCCSHIGELVCARIV